MGLKSIVVRSCKRTRSEVCFGKKLETFLVFSQIHFIALQKPPVMVYYFIFQQDPGTFLMVGHTGNARMN